MGHNANRAPSLSQDQGHSPKQDPKVGTVLAGFDLSGRVALVTGAARGIGRACAVALAEAGADVAVGLRDIATGGEVVAAIEGTGRRALAVQMDVTKLDEISNAVAEVARHFGRIDILVNNAGIGPPNPAEAVTEADFDATVVVNLKGTFFVSQAVGRLMIGGGGRIINLGSQAGVVALPTESVYCMTKAAIAHLTKCLAVEWARHGSTSTPSRRHSSGRREPPNGWRTKRFEPICCRAFRWVGWASHPMSPGRLCSWRHPRRL